MHSPTFRTLIATRYHRNTSALKLDPKQFNAITQALDAIIRQDMRNDHSGNYQDLAMATIDALKQRNQTNSPELRSLLSIFEQRDNSCESLKQKAWEIFVLMEKKINQQLKIDWFSQDDVFITRRLEKNYPLFLEAWQKFFQASSINQSSIEKQETLLSKIENCNTGKEILSIIEESQKELATSITAQTPVNKLTDQTINLDSLKQYLLDLQSQDLNVSIREIEEACNVTRHQFFHALTGFSNGFIQERENLQILIFDTLTRLVDLLMESRPQGNLQQILLGNKSVSHFTYLVERGSSNINEFLIELNELRNLLLRKSPRPSPDLVEKIIKQQTKRIQNPSSFILLQDDFDQDEEIISRMNNISGLIRSFRSLEFDSKKINSKNISPLEAFTEEASQYTTQKFRSKYTNLFPSSFWVMNGINLHKSLGLNKDEDLDLWKKSYAQYIQEDAWELARETRFLISRGMIIIEIPNFKINDTDYCFAFLNHHFRGGNLHEAIAIPTKLIHNKLIESEDVNSFDFHLSSIQDEANKENLEIFALDTFPDIANSLHPLKRGTQLGITKELNSKLSTVNSLYKIFRVALAKSKSDGILFNDNCLSPSEEILEYYNQAQRNPQFKAPCLIVAHALDWTNIATNDLILDTKTLELKQGKQHLALLNKDNLADELNKYLFPLITDNTGYLGREYRFIRQEHIGANL